MFVEAHRKSSFDGYEYAIELRLDTVPGCINRFHTWKRGDIDGMSACIILRNGGLGYTARTFLRSSEESSNCKKNFERTLLHFLEQVERVDSGCEKRSTAVWKLTLR